MLLALTKYGEDEFFARLRDDRNAVVLSLVFILFLSGNFDMVNSFLIPLADSGANVKLMMYIYDVQLYEGGPLSFSSESQTAETSFEY